MESWKVSESERNELVSMRVSESVGWVYTEK